MVSLGVIAGEHRRRFVGDFAGGFSFMSGVMCNNYRESKCKSIEVEEIVCLIRCFKLHTNMSYVVGKPVTGGR
uniref:Uncharacterized protein n=1 Tax=Leersia perrieri TaxID=77586 RepID=A0A0D9WEE7_9ORYZ